MPYHYGKSAPKQILPKGYYQAVIGNAVAKHSRSGNEMLQLKLEIDGEIVYDFLVNVPSMLWKTKQFVEAMGGNPEAGEIDEARCIGKRVTVFLDTETTPPYPTKNVVSRYGYAKEDQPLGEEPQGDVPF